MFKAENGKVINSETKIEFTIGKFLGLVGSIISGMLAMFIGFYFMVFEPRVTNEIESLKSHYSLMQEKENALLKAELKPYIESTTKIESKLIIIEGKVDGISGRFNDLNRIQNQQSNTGGLSRTD